MSIQYPVSMHPMPARVETSQGRTGLKCPVCGKTLAELHDQKVVIKAGQRYIIFALTNDAVERCPDQRCGADSLVSAPSHAETATP